MDDKDRRISRFTWPYIIENGRVMKAIVLSFLSVEVCLFEGIVNNMASSRTEDCAT